MSRYHYTIVVPCEGTAEDKPCSERGLGILKIAECGELGRAEEIVPPEGWEPIKARKPMVQARMNRNECSPFAGIYEVASKTHTDQVGLTCKKCSEHLKVEDLVKQASVAKTDGSLQ